MKRVPVLTLCALLFALSTYAAEPTPDPRLVEITREKSRLEEQADRGRLLIENAQLKFRELVEREKAIAAEVASKEQNAKGKAPAKTE